jgi:hypothetical protein
MVSGRGFLSDQRRKGEGVPAAVCSWYCEGWACGVTAGSMSGWARE